MKKSISDLYEQILLNEAEKNSLQNPSNDEVGELPSENMFGEVPKTVKGEGPEKAKLAKGPSYNKIDMGSSPSASKQTNTKLPNSKPAKSAETEDEVEMEDEDVVPNDPEKDKVNENPYKKKTKPHEESFTMSAFENLFKKTLQEELEEDNLELEETSDEGDEMEEPENEMEEEGEAEEEIQEEEEDLISDLRGLQSKLNSILDKLEALEAEEEAEDYTEEEFDDEFGEEEEEEEEMPVKESMQSGLKPVNKGKIKTLQNKKNKVGKVSPKGGKAKTNNIKVSPNPKALGDKKKAMQSHNNKVKSSVDKGDFFK